MFELAEQRRLPMVLFAEGGGGRPGDTDGVGVAGSTAWRSPASASCRAWCRWSAINSGRCFAGNAALLGCCDVIIATAELDHRHGRPGDDRGRRPRRLPPEEVGPMSVQVPNGVVDVAVADEAEAVAVAKQYLSYFQGAAGRLGVRRPAAAAPRRSPRTGCASTTCARVIDDARRRRLACSSCAATFGIGMITALVRIEGRPLGRHRQQPDAPRRRDRLRRRRQGRALHAALRRLRPADPVPLRHARASWSAPRSRRPRWCATAAACSSSAPT